MAAVDAPTSPPLVATPGRELAARALQAGPDCSQQRIGDLLGVSRRTIGRMVDADLSTALRDPQVLEVARTCLAETTGRGCTSRGTRRGARMAAGGGAGRTPGRTGRTRTPGRTGAGASRRAAARRPAPLHARRPSHNGAHRTGATTPTAGTADAAALLGCDAVNTTTRWRPLAPRAAHARRVSTRSDASSSAFCIAARSSTTCSRPRPALAVR